MKKIICDVDDVITQNCYVNWVNEYKGLTSPHLFTLNDVKGYYVEDSLLKNDQKDIESFHDWLIENKKDFYAENTLMHGCYEVLEKLCKVYDVILASACASLGWAFGDPVLQRLREKQWAHEFEDKLNFLREKLPFVKPSNIILINRKDLLCGDVRIDDRLKHLQGSGNIKLLFDSWHNKEITEAELSESGVNRISGWKQIGEILL